MKAALLSLSLVLVSFSAQAVRFEGTIASRQACSDTGGIFAKVLECKKMPLQDRRCIVDVDFAANLDIKKVKVQIPEVKKRGESWWSSLSTSFKGPFIVDSAEHVYSKSISSSIAVEVGTLPRSGGISRLNLYTSQRTDKQSAIRYYTQYECRSLVRK